MLQISQQDFLRVVKFLHDRFGIDLSKKKQLIEGRLYKPFTDSGYDNFTSYIDAMMKGDAKDLDALLNRLTTNHTYFMRESSHFDILGEKVLPELESRKRDKVLGIWSAGCSRGQEPYTISMILKDYFENKPGWDTRVLATDISQNAMDAAKAAVYDAEDMDDVPERWKRKYMTLREDQYTFNQSIRGNVIYRTFNLMDPIRFKLKFDVIFCRNVMIYFDQPTKDALVRRFYEATNPGGYLFVGHAETLNKYNNPYKSIDVAAYVKA